jgi:hypothetical protein
MHKSPNNLYKHLTLILETPCVYEEIKVVYYLGNNSGRLPFNKQLKSFILRIK